MFALQILATSVMYPAWFIRYLRAQATSIPAERLAQLFPGVDLSRAQERLLTRYRALNTGTALLGAALLGWLFGYMRRPDWNDGPVEALVSVFFMAQMVVPVGLIG